MNKEYSLYLDIMRFLAALVVFLAHASSQSLTNGLFWQFKEYAQTAVILFFLMSGFVIAYVTDTKERTILDYSIARISRLYSVVIPALILTFVFDFIGIFHNPELYYEGPAGYPAGQQYIHYLLSFIMLNNIWDLQLNPGINGPFWSITFEVIYYIIFALAFFINSRLKWLLIFLICVLAGPTIIILFPIWLMGYHLYFFHKKIDLYRFPILYSFIAILALALIIVFSPSIRNINVSIPFVGRDEVLGDYFDAVFFYIHILFIGTLLKVISPVLLRFEIVIRWLASLTFALYLFHRPIIQYVAAAYRETLPEHIYMLIMYIGTFLFIATLGRYCESQKHSLNKLIRKAIDSIPSNKS